MLATEVVLGRNSMRTVELGPHTALLGSSRVRIHDLRTDKIALSLSAHQLGVSAVQMDDWKIVSGGEEGLVSVWDYRMNQKLWEVHSR
jgi:F-box/WD-40 domain protein 8